MIAPPSSLSPFAEAGPALAAMDHSPLPIAPGEKFPGLPGVDRWHPMRNWQEFCRKPVRPNIIAGWSRLPDAGVGVALGRGLIAVDVDRDNLVEAILTALPWSPVMKVGRKGITAFFREGSTPVASRNYQGFLDLLAAGKQTVLPPSRHPSGTTYAWTTERTLCDTPLSGLPEFPADGVAIIESVLSRFGWEAKAARPEHVPMAAGRALTPASGPFTGDLDEVNNVALGALSSWVPFLNLPKLALHGQGYRAVTSFRPSGSGKADSARNPNLSFHPTGIVDYGDGGRYRPVGVVEKALGLDWRDAARWLADRIGYTLAEPAAEPIIILKAGASAPSRRGEIAPPEQPERRPLAEVKAALSAELGAFATRTVVEHRHKRAAYDEAIRANAIGCAGGALSFTPLPPEPVVTARCLGAETGAGKTHAFEHATAAASRAGFRIYGAFPRHDVAEQVAGHLRGDHGIAARAYRGRHAVDPEAAEPSALMCLAPDDAKAAEDSRLPVYETVCASADGARCPFYDRCGYIKQRQAEPVVWLVPHASLLSQRPAHIEAPHGLVIDETLSIIPGASADTAKDETQRLGVDALAHMPTEVEADVARSATLATMRPRLVAAFRNAAEGFLTRETLTIAGITADGASAAADAERGRVVLCGMFPGMESGARAIAAKQAGAVNGETMAASGLWFEIATFLRQDVPRSGRLRIVLDPKTKAGRIEWRSLKGIHPSWLTGPVLFTDATPPGKAYVEAAVGRGVQVEVAHMLAVERNLHGQLIQVLSAPTGASKLGFVIGKKAADGSRNRAAVLRYVQREAMMAGPLRTVVVIASKKMEAWLAQQGLPPNVDLGHFYGVSGVDRWRKAASVIVVGIHRRPLRAVEADAGVLTGIPTEELAPGSRGELRFQRVPGAILKADGTKHVVERDLHPDPAAELLRWRDGEGEILQAIGRLRQVHRDSIEPWRVAVLSNQPLPLAVDEVQQWDAVVPGMWTDLLHGGVLFEDRAEISKAWPGRWSDDEARGREFKTSGVCPNQDSVRGDPQTLRATFRRKGKREVVAWLLPGGPRSAAAFEAWLTAEERGFEGVADLVVERPPVDRALVSAVVRSMDEDTPASPGDVWQRVEARLGQPATAMERSMLRLVAMREGDARFVERKPWDDAEAADKPLPADCGVEGEDGEAIGPGAWRRHRAT